MVEKEAVSVPGNKIDEVIIDPVSQRVGIVMNDGTYVVVLPDQKIIVTKDGKGEIFKNFDDFCDFVLKNTPLKIIPGGLKDESEESQES